MYKLLTGLFSYLVLLVAPVFAQQTDSIPQQKELVYDTAFNSWKTTTVRKEFPYKTLLLPSMLVVYGVNTLRSDGFKNFNEEVKEEVWTEHAHKQMHIDNYLQYAPAAAVYALNAAGIKGKNNFRDRTIIYGMATAMVTGVVVSVKGLTKEMRPDDSNKSSFPSGHTATAFAAAEFLRQEYKDVSPWYGIAGYAAAAATGYLRMYNNKHWLSDVVAGAGVGILSTRFAYQMYPAIKRVFCKKSESSTIVLPTYQNGAIGVGLVHRF